METPGLKASQSPLEGPPLCAECVAIFKTMVMGKAALAFDRAGIRFVRKRAARAMASLTFSA